MAPCVNARSPATSTTLIVTGLFGNAGTCAVAPVAVQAITSTLIQKRVARRATAAHDCRLTLACASAESVLKILPPQHNGATAIVVVIPAYAAIHFFFSTKSGSPLSRG